MADWDANSPRLTENLVGVLRRAHAAACRRDAPSLNLMRCGLPPVMRLRPRPNDGYGGAGAAAMTGDWMPTAAVIRRMLAGPFTS